MPTELIPRENQKASRPSSSPINTMLRNVCRRALAEAASFSGGSKEGPHAWRTISSCKGSSVVGTARGGGSCFHVATPKGRRSASSTSRSHAAHPSTEIGAIDDLTVELHPWSKLPLQIAVGMGVASFWRGAWYVMDTSIFPDDNLKSGAACLVAGTAGLAKLQRYAASEVHKRYIAKNIPPPPSLRYGLLYGMGLSCVAVWRGTWCMWDSLFERFDPWAFKGDAGVRNGEDEESSSPGEPQMSENTFTFFNGVASHVVAIAGLTAAGYLSSVLSPPAVCFLLNDEALRKRACAVNPAYREEARREFLKGAAWLFGNAGPVKRAAK